MKNRDNLIRNIAFVDNLTKFISCDFEAIQSKIKVDGSIKTKILGLNCLLWRIFLWNLFDNQLKAGKKFMPCSLTNFGLFWQIAFDDTVVLCIAKSQIHIQRATRKKIKTWEPTHKLFSRFWVMIESPAKVRGRLGLYFFRYLQREAETD